MFGSTAQETRRKTETAVKIQTLEDKIWNNLRVKVSTCSSSSTEEEKEAFTRPTFGKFASYSNNAVEWNEILTIN